MTLHLLGTGAGASDPDRTTTMLAVEHGGATVLIDCGGDAGQALLRSGLDPSRLDAVVLTHEHPDHISGFPLLIERMWLLGRRDPIAVYGPAATLAVARQLFALFNTAEWPGLPPLVWHPVELRAGASVLALGALVMTATPVDHPVPTIGLRIAVGDAVVAYSCDTAPSKAVRDLAHGASLLVHEATGHLPGVHSSPEDAARAARDAGVDDLVLVHAPVGACEEDLAAARALVARTRWGTDGERIELSGGPT